MLPRYLKISLLLLAWVVLGTLLCTFILAQLQFVDRGAYRLIPPELAEKPILHFFPSLCCEDMELAFLLLYGFMHWVIISLVVLAGYRVYKYFKKHGQASSLIVRS